MTEPLTFGEGAWSVSFFTILAVVIPLAIISVFKLLDVLEERTHEDEQKWWEKL